MNWYRKAQSISNNETLPPWKMRANSREYADMDLADLERAAFGFTHEEIRALLPDQLNVKWQEDFKNVVEEQDFSGLSPEEWASSIDLTAPIDVSYENGKFYIEDGHHRYYAAKILNKPLNVDLQIKDKPHQAIVEKALKSGELSVEEYNKLHADIYGPKAYASGSSWYKVSAFTPEDDGYYYHITSTGRLDAVLENGLIPGSGGQMGEGFYSEYSHGKLFFTDVGGVDFWKGRIGEHMEYNEVEEGLVVLRFPKDEVGELPSDDLGDRDNLSSKSYYTDRPIVVNPEIVEVEKRQGGPDILSSKNIWYKTADDRSPSVEEHERVFQTGTPVKFKYLRGKEKAGDYGDLFQQHIEPHGRYMLHNPAPGDLSEDLWESGDVEFQNPLVIWLNENPEGSIYDDNSWKAKLMEMYSGKVGAELSQAIIADGYDGVVTITKGPDGQPVDTREIVDLTNFRISKKEKMIRVAEGVDPQQVFYHGTIDPIDKFQVGAGSGSEFFAGWFTPSPDYAEEMLEVKSNSYTYNNDPEDDDWVDVTPNIIPVYLDVKKPFDITSIPSTKEVTLREMFAAAGADWSPELDVFDKEGRMSNWRWFTEYGHPLFFNEIKRQGFDGVKQLESGFFVGVGVFDPGQITSAISGVKMAKSEDWHKTSRLESEQPFKEGEFVDWLNPEESPKDIQVFPGMPLYSIGMVVSVGEGTCLVQWSTGSTVEVDNEKISKIIQYDGERYFNKQQTEYNNEANRRQGESNNWYKTSQYYTDEDLDEMEKNSIRYLSSLRRYLSENGEITNGNILKSISSGISSEIDPDLKYSKDQEAQRIIFEIAKEIAESDPEYSDIKKYFSKEHFINLSALRYLDSLRKYLSENGKITDPQELNILSSKLHGKVDPSLNARESGKDKSEIFKRAKEISLSDKRYLDLSIYLEGEQRPLHTHAALRNSELRRLRKRFNNGELDVVFESRKRKGMTSGNRSFVHMDHIIPDSHFYYSSKHSPLLKLCFSEENIQPEWGVLNIKKRNTYVGRYGTENEQSPEILDHLNFLNSKIINIETDSFLNRIMGDELFSGVDPDDVLSIQGICVDYLLKQNKRNERNKKEIKKLSKGSRPNPTLFNFFCSARYEDYNEEEFYSEQIQRKVEKVVPIEDFEFITNYLTYYNENVSFEGMPADQSKNDIINSMIGMAAEQAVDHTEDEIRSWFSDPDASVEELENLARQAGEYLEERQKLIGEIKQICPEEKFSPSTTRQLSNDQLSGIINRQDCNLEIVAWSERSCHRYASAQQGITESPEFKAWFGNSKVVKEDGSPKRVFHGTDSAEEFDVKNFKTPAFFTSSPGESGMYSSGVVETQNAWNGPRISYDPAVHNFSKQYIFDNCLSCSMDIREEIARKKEEGVDVRDIVYNDGNELWQLANPEEFYKEEYAEPKLALIDRAVLDWKYDGTPPKVVPYEKEQRARTFPVYLKIENPFHMEANAAAALENFSPHALATVEKLKEQGYDGVFADSDFALALHYIAFYPEQIRSALSFQANNSNWYKTSAYPVRDAIEYEYEPELSNNLIGKMKTIYPLAGEMVDGRKVRDYVSNVESISAGFNHWIELPGIREVRMAPDESPNSKNPYILELAEKIRESGEITPLIIEINNEGVWIIEGMHRLQALYVLGAKSFPAVVVLDSEKLEKLDQNIEMMDLLNLLEEEPFPDPDGRTQGDFLQDFNFSKIMNNNLHKTAWGDPAPDLSEELIEKIEFGDIDSNPQLIEMLKAEGVDADLIKFNNGDEIVAYGSEGDRQIIDLDLNEIKDFNDWIFNVHEHEMYSFLGDVPEENFWDEVSDGFVVYHGTPAERINDIKRDGLEPRCESRGVSNRNTSCGVFTSREEYGTESYTGENGAAIEIDVGAMKRDGYMPRASGEEPFEEERMRSLLAHKVGGYYEEDGFSSDGISPDTVIFYETIPPKYLKFPEIVESKVKKQYKLANMVEESLEFEPWRYTKKQIREKVLFHGTGEEIEGDLTGGGYDKILWTAEDSTTAQNYIPVSSYIVFCTDRFTLKHVLKPEGSFEEALISQMGYSFETKKDEHGRVRSFWFYDEDGESTRGPTFSMVLKFIEDLGYKKEEGSSHNCFKIKTSFQDGKYEILPADYAREGHLYMMYGDRSNLNIFDYTEGREGDLTDVDYHKLDFFKRLKEEGYDGVRINDFAQSENWGNIEHKSVGLFPSGLEKMKEMKIPAKNFDWGEDIGGVFNTSEFHNWHKQEVLSAIERGEDVPQEVIDDVENANVVISNNKNWYKSAQVSYLYHGTSEGALRKIAIEGLRPISGRVLFSDSELYAQSYADRKGGARGVMLRVQDNGSFAPDENIPEGGDFFTTETISPSDIEVKMRDGLWSPLTTVDISFGLPDSEARKSAWYKGADLVPLPFDDQGVRQTEKKNRSGFVYGYILGYGEGEYFSSVFARPWQIENSFAYSNLLYSLERKYENKIKRLTKMKEDKAEEVAEELPSAPREEQGDFLIDTYASPRGIKKTAQVQTISPQEAFEKKLFGPVFHGTTSENMQAIQEEGFQVFVGEERSGNVSHGYEDWDYHEGTPPPIHHLGYGIYFTTVKNIAKDFNYGTTKGLKEFYLDVPRLETINFGVPRTMMKWWVENGYSPEVAKVDRLAATNLLTQNLSSQYDAVWFKGKGLNRLLDGDQICVYDSSRIYMVDKTLVQENEIGSRVKRLSDGMLGNIWEAVSVEQMIKEVESFGENHYLYEVIYEDGVEWFFRVKWRKGGMDYNFVTNKEVIPY